MLIKVGRYFFQGTPTSSHSMFPGITCVILLHPVSQGPLIRTPTLATALQNAHTRPLTPVHPSLTHILHTMIGVAMGPILAHHPLHRLTNLRGMAWSE